MRVTFDGDRTPRETFWTARFFRWTEPLWAALGELETRVLKRRLPPVDRPIYVLGLARAGTTITLEMLSRHPDAVTHRLIDLVTPFTPVLWSRLVSLLPFDGMQPRERPHRDGIMVTPLSPEAGEERIWMHFFRGLHDEERSAVLDQSFRALRFERAYRGHIRKLLHVRGRSRYVAKGNYNVTRMSYLRTVFPDARFILLVRHPVHQIASLMKQDRHFTRIAASDPLLTPIMDLMGHYEFGTGLRWLNVGDNETMAEIRRNYASGREARAWGLYWSSLYGFVSRQLAADPELAAVTAVIRYEDLCDAPEATIDRIVGHSQLEPDAFHSARAEYARKLHAPDYYRPSFTEAEMADIAETTRGTAARFGYDESSFHDRRVC